MVDVVSGAFSGLRATGHNTSSSMAADTVTQSVTSTNVYADCEAGSITWTKSSTEGRLQLMELPDSHNIASFRSPSQGGASIDVESRVH